MEVRHRLRIVHHHRFGDALASARWDRSRATIPGTRHNGRIVTANLSWISGMVVSLADTDQHARSLRLGKLRSRAARSAVQEEEVGSGSGPRRQWAQVTASAAGEPEAVSGAPRSGSGIQPRDRETPRCRGPGDGLHVRTALVDVHRASATSPRAIRDVLSVKDDSVDKTTPVFDQMRNIIGANLADLPFEPWKARRRTLQPVFTKQRVNEFGAQMAQTAQAVRDGWREDGDIDLDVECRALTFGALGGAVLGIDLEGRADQVVEPLRVALTYAMGRATRPLRAPKWLPTPARRRARAATAQLQTLTRQILEPLVVCRIRAGWRRWCGRSLPPRTRKPGNGCRTKRSATS